MAILSSSSIVSESLWILFLTTVMSFHPKQVAGMIDVELYSREDDFGEFDESFKTDLDVSSSSASLVHFPHNHRHSKTHHREEIPLDLAIEAEHFDLPMDFPRIRHRSIQQTSTRSETNVNEKPALPSRFSFVARQFYHYVWERRNTLRKDVRGATKSDKNFRKSQESEENTWDNDDDDKEEDEVPANFLTTASPSDNPKVPHNTWRNIVDAPPSSCPPGQRKDSNGQCRTVLW